MRNLKRALSLALASVMVLGMMVVGAGAVGYDDFSDKDKIANVEAVSMLVELNVINGKDDGNFDPNGIVTRAEMAKMICVVLNGGKDPSLGTVTNYTYTDTVGHWAAAYIEYCTNQGIVAGDGTGKFNPSNTVTGSEAAKMLLVAAGYQSAIEGFTGANWAVSTNVRANQAGLYDDVDGSPSDGLSRDNAAQMVYNALNANVVKYDYVMTSDGKGGFTSIPNLEDTKETVLEDKFGAVKIEGVVLGNEYADLNSTSAMDEGKTRIDVTDGNDTIKEGTGTFSVSSNLDVIGKQVTLYVKPSNNNELANKATVLGNVILSSENKIVTTTADEDADDIDDLLDDNGLEIGKAKYFINYDPSAKITVNEAGKALSFIDFDDDGEVDYVLQVVKTFGKVASHSTNKDGSIYVNAVNPVSGDKSLNTKGIQSTDALDDVKGFEDVEKDDYVFFYEIDGVEFVEKAESVEATVTSTKGAKITADGTTYEASGVVAYYDEDSSEDKLSGAVSVGDDAVLYMDEFGYVALVTDVDSTDDYVYVVEADTWSKVAKSSTSRIVLADGSTAIVEAYVDNDGTKEKPDSGEAYSYSVKSDGVYKLTAETTKTSGLSVTKNTAKLGTGAYANKNTIFVVSRSSDNYSVYTGIANVPDMTLNVYAAIMDGTTVDILFVADGSLTGEQEGVYVLSKDASVTKDGDDKIYTYDVIYEGEKTTLKSVGTDLKFPAKGYYSDVSVNGDEITDYVKSSLVAPTEADICKNGLVGVEGQDPLTYNDDTVFLLVDGSDVTVVSDGTVVISNLASANSNIVIVEDPDSDGLALYVFICEE